MKLSIFEIFVVLSLTTTNAVPMSAQNQQRSEYGKQPERTITADPAANNPKKGVDETDQTFMRDTAIGNEAEMQLGQMAQEKASNPAVKSFGERMIKDHSDGDTKLKNIAQSQGISLPVAPDPEHKEASERVSRLSGPQFDEAYMLLMVQEHTKDVNKFKQEAANAHNDAVKQFAAATLPILQSHLSEAQQLAKQVNAK